MEPHLVKWHRKYSDKGLTIIEIDNGRIDPLQAVQSHVREASLPFPVVHDTAGIMCSNYGVRLYPTAYLIGRHGRVIWGGVPIADPSGVEKLIQAALRKGMKDEGGRMKGEG